MLGSADGVGILDLFLSPEAMELPPDGVRGTVFAGLPLVGSSKIVQIVLGRTGVACTSRLVAGRFSDLMCFRSD